MAWSRNKAYHILLLKLLHVVLAIVAAGIVAGIAAFIVSNITSNKKIIIVSCLVSVWIAEVAIYVLLCRITYRQRIKGLNNDSLKELSAKKNTLRKWYVISTIIFSAVLGFVFYNLKDQLVNSLEGAKQSDLVPKAHNMTFLYIKIAIIAILIGWWLFRRYRRKQIEN